MAKKRSASSAPVSRVEKNVKLTLDKNLDFSHIPESTDGELKKARRVGRPTSGHAKQLIALRISPEVLSKLKKMAEKAGKPYQTFIHELLAKMAKKVS
jgi:uncharacterized protein (DUF4415 family)